MLITVRMAKNMMDSISPLAMAWMGLLGTMLMSTSESGGASLPVKLASDVAFIPSPMPIAAATPIALAMATAVVNRYQETLAANSAQELKIADPTHATYERK